MKKTSLPPSPPKSTKKERRNFFAEGEITLLYIPNAMPTTFLSLLAW